MPSEITQKAKQEIAAQALNLVTEAGLKLVLVDNAYVASKNRDFVDDGTANDIASHEINVTGYTPGFGGGGRKVPSGRIINRDDANARLEFDFNDQLWTALGAGATIGGVALIVEKTNDADSWDLGFDDTPDVPTNGGDIEYQPNAEGVFQW
jgi:hypothetical protein